MVQTLFALSGKKLMPKHSPTLRCRVDLISTSELTQAFVAFLQASKWSNYRENAFSISVNFNLVMYVSKHVHYDAFDNDL